MKKINFLLVLITISFHRVAQGYENPYYNTVDVTCHKGTQRIATFGLDFAERVLKFNILALKGGIESLILKPKVKFQGTIEEAEKNPFWIRQTSNDDGFIIHGTIFEDNDYLSNLSFTLHLEFISDPISRDLDNLKIVKIDISSDNEILNYIFSLKNGISLNSLINQKCSLVQFSS